MLKERTREKINFACILSRCVNQRVKHSAIIFHAANTRKCRHDLVGIDSMLRQLHDGRTLNLFQLFRRRRTPIAITACARGTNKSRRASPFLWFLNLCMIDRRLCERCAAHSGAKLKVTTCTSGSFGEFPRYLPTEQRRINISMRKTRAPTGPTTSCLWEILLAWLQVTRMQQTARVKPATQSDMFAQHNDNTHTRYWGIEVIAAGEIYTILT